MPYGQRRADDAIDDAVVADFDEDCDDAALHKSFLLPPQIHDTVRYGTFELLA